MINGHTLKLPDIHTLQLYAADNIFMLPIVYNHYIQELSALERRGKLILTANTALTIYTDKIKQRFK